MGDENQYISSKTWARSVNPIHKAGYMDGAADAQSSTFQSSFDKGYKQGFSFGMQIGLKEAMINASQQHNRLLQEHLTDPRKINCQVCLNNAISQENIINLYNIQKEKNEEFVENLGGLVLR